MKVVSVGEGYPRRAGSDLSIVAMPLQVLFDFFSSTLESEITLAKSMGNYETGEGCLAGYWCISVLGCPELHDLPGSAS